VTTSPTISAIIPAYNSAPYVGQAIASVRAQTHAVDEIIVVDDGSVDETPEVIGGLGEDVRCIRQENAGPSAARNRGVAEAGGEFIAFLDADDQWTPEKTRHQLAALERHPELALVAGDMAEIDVDGRIVVPSVLEKHAIRDGFAELQGAPIPDALAMLVRINFIPTGTVLVRRKAIEEAGGFPEEIRYGEDLALWARIAARHPIACLPDVLMLRRRHGENATEAVGPLLADLVRVMDSIRRACSEALRSQGVDPDQLAANAWADLGYWHFAAGDLEKARHAFSASWRERPSRRAFFFRFFSMLPKPLVAALRRLKHHAAA